ncbi:MAG: hypothetical protein RLZZ584_400 [Pseudomonadota bacterium]
MALAGVLLPLAQLWAATPAGPGGAASASTPPMPAPPPSAGGSTVATGSAGLPAPIAAALARARIAPEAAFVWVGPAAGGPARLAHQAEQLANPASVIKLVTAAVALDTLGPTYTWATTVHVDGSLKQGVLHGNLVLKGGGDARLVSERLWLLLQRVQQIGVREVTGDIVIDRSAFELPDIDPGVFDGERHRPYNVQPDAFIVNGKTVVLSFHPEPALGLARIGAEPRLAGVDIPTSVPLVRADCGDWRSQLQADFSQPGQIRFGGRYALACGDRNWPVAYGDPASYNARAVAALWRDLGGKLAGKVRDGRVAPGSAALLEFVSPTLAEVVRDMNKHSNNLIAQHLFLTLSLAQQGVGRYEASRELMLARVRERAGCAADALRIDKGSGLSRDERVTPVCLARVLQARRATGAAGRAHLKTGSLANVAALAGVVHGPDGRRQIVVAIINHPQAGSDEARAALDAVLRWTLDDKDRQP